MKSFRAKPVGWRYESHRHYLAAKGVSTSKYFSKRRYNASALDSLFSTMDRLAFASRRYPREIVPMKEAAARGVLAGKISDVGEKRAALEKRNMMIGEQASLALRQQIAKMRDAQSRAQEMERRAMAQRAAGEAILRETFAHDDPRYIRIESETGYRTKLKEVPGTEKLRGLSKSLKAQAAEVRSRMKAGGLTKDQFEFLKRKAEKLSRDSQLAREAEDKISSGFEKGDPEWKKDYDRLRRAADEWARTTEQTTSDKQMEVLERLSAVLERVAGSGENIQQPNVVVVPLPTVAGAAAFSAAQGAQASTVLPEEGEEESEETTEETPAKSKSKGTWRNVRGDVARDARKEITPVKDASAAFRESVAGLGVRNSEYQRRKEREEEKEDNDADLTVRLKKGRAKEQEVVGWKENRPYADIAKDMARGGNVSEEDLARVNALSGDRKKGFEKELKRQIEVVSFAKGKKYAIPKGSALDKAAANLLEKIRARREGGGDSEE